MINSGILVVHYTRTICSVIFVNINSNIRLARYKLFKKQKKVPADKSNIVILCHK